MLAYKLFREMKDGSIKSLFIDKRHALPFDTWLVASDVPTKGFAHRPGWHCTDKPEAPHLSMKGRGWYEVEVDPLYYYEHPRPAKQGGMWYICTYIKILGKVET